MYQADTRHVVVMTGREDRVFSGMINREMDIFYHIEFHILLQSDDKGVPRVHF